jgi:hypothetical protein
VASKDECFTLWRCPECRALRKVELSVPGTKPRQQFCVHFARPRVPMELITVVRVDG